MASFSQIGKRNLSLGDKSSEIFVKLEMWWKKGEV